MTSRADGDHDIELSRRRLVRAGAAVVLTTGVAGCGGDNDTTDDQTTRADGTETAQTATTDTTQATPTTEAPPTDTTDTEEPPAVSTFEFTQSTDRIALPPVWTSRHSIADFTNSMSVEIAADEALGTVTIKKNGETWKEWTDQSQTFSSGELVLTPNQLQAGQNTFQVDLRADVQQQIDQKLERTTVKDVPEAFKIDLRHGTNSQLRDEIERKVDDHEEFLSQAEDQVTDATTSYTSHDLLEFDKREIDLAAMDFFHKNNFDVLASEPPQGGFWMKRLVDALNDPGSFTEPKKNPLTIEYVDGEGEFGSFDFEEDFKNATSLAEAHNELIRYIANFEAQVNDRGMFSGRDEIYAALIQECFDRYNDDVDAHAWSFNIDFGGHGNGMMYDETNDILYEMETVIDKGLMPTPIEESQYLEEDSWWHPVQFAYQDFDGDRFFRAKTEAAKMLKNIASIGRHEEQNGYPGDNPNFTLTTDLVKQGARALGEYNLSDTDYEFDNIRNVARTIEWCNRSDGSYVISADSGDSIGANVYDITGYTEEHGEDILVDIWEDEGGIYDGFVEVTMEYESGDHSSLSEAAEVLA